MWKVIYKDATESEPMAYEEAIMEVVHQDGQATILKVEVFKEVHKARGRYFEE